MKFSVIIPCYNIERYVARSIESVINQTYCNFELILVDDGSTDNTLSIMMEYRVKDPRISVYSKKNGGVSSARNEGLSNATGDFILFFDGDDMLESRLLERAAKVLSDDEIEMFSFGYKKINDSNNKAIKHYSSQKYDGQVFSGDELMKLFFTKKISQHICSMIVRKDIIIMNDIKFNINTKYAEDQEFQLHCMSKCNKIYYDSNELFLYVDRADSAMNKKYNRKDFDVYVRFEKHVSEDNKIYYYNYLCFVFVNNIIALFKNGSEKSVIIRLLEFDYVLDRFSIQNSKYIIYTAFFIPVYKLILKKRLKKDFWF